MSTTGTLAVAIHVATFNVLFTDLILEIVLLPVSVTDSDSK